LQRDVLHQVKKRPKIAALDTMNYWIERSNAELRETLKHVDILMINDSETRELSSEHNCCAPPSTFSRWGRRRWS